MRLVPILLILGLCCSGCGPTVIFEQRQELPAAGWSYADTARFAFQIPSTETAYDFVLQLEHGTEFPYQNFYIKLYTGFPSGKRATQQLSLQLAGDYGEWLGDCSGTTCTEDITFLHNARFAVAGDYYLTIEQNSRDEPLEAIKSVGFAVIEAE